jgi:hypothetical protein
MIFHATESSIASLCNFAEAERFCEIFCNTKK